MACTRTFGVIYRKNLPELPIAQYIRNMHHEMDLDAEKGFFQSISTVCSGQVSMYLRKEPDRSP